MAPKRKTRTASADDRALADLLATCAADPLRFVLAAFDWGRGELEGHDGPDAWQRDVLAALRDGLAAGRVGAESSAAQAVRLAVASGHGIGKSALVAWLLLWGLATRADCRGIVTANTEAQLRTKTWAELAKWHRLCLFRRWFVRTATALHAADSAHEQTWRIDAVAWSKANPAAFAGLHNQGKRVLLVFDEASEIDDVVWEVSEGALTDADTEILWLAFGNPTRNTGRFRECFGRFRHRWTTRQVDSRTARMTNKALLDQWVADYGEDSDFVRVRVKGTFPRAGSMQLIAADIVERAAAAEAQSSVYDPLVMAVDVARFGADQSVIGFRRGRDARSVPMEKHRGLDTMQLAARCAVLIERHRPDAVFIDETGVGGGVVDRLRQLGHSVVGVAFGARPDGAVDGEKVANKRAEMWVRMRAWLTTGGAIPDDRDLAADLGGVEYGYTIHNEIQLEKKDDMKKRGLASPDAGDALALTFAYPVARRERGPGRFGALHVPSEFDPFA
ncbi:MAG: terminase [Magnetospirillum sp.]|nr:terminase [Magnetospirillum sp.]